jgi:2-isopropylmalate synthase
MAQDEGIAGLYAILRSNVSTAIDIYDTTLRDGTQGQGISFSVADKLRIAERLDAFGFHFIEGGWPGSNPKDIEFFERARGRTFGRARLAAFGSTRRKDVRADADEQVRLLVDAATPAVTIYGKTWLLHVREVLQTTPDENLAMIGDTVRFLKAAGRFVVYDAEHAFDGCKDDREYAAATWRAAEAAGADVIVLCDTNGGSLPSEVAEITRLARTRLSGQIGIHTHDDIGLGVANALAAIEAGATHVQGTLNGYGERTGNCNLTTVIPDIEFKMHRPSVPPESLVTLTELSQFVDEIANLQPNTRLPWVGSAAFSHKGGTHVNAVQKVLRSYEHIDPAVVGNTRHVLVSDLSGRSNIVMKARELGVDLDQNTPELRTILQRVKTLEHEGYEFEAADGSLALLIARVTTPAPPPFTVDAYHVSMRAAGQTSVCEATVKVRGGGPHRRRRRRPGERARRRASRGAARVLPRAEPGPPHRLQGPHRQFGGRHRGDHARPHRVHRWIDVVDDHRREPEHHRGQPHRPRRQPRIRTHEGSEGVTLRSGRLARAAAFVTAAALGAAGCSSGSPASAPQAEGGAPAAAAQAAPASGAHLVQGTAPLAVNNGVVIVTLAPEPARDLPPVSGDPPQMDQVNLTFVPAVLLVRTGEPVRFLNNDDVLHNVRVREEATGAGAFNVAGSISSDATSIRPCRRRCLPPPRRTAPWPMPAARSAFRTWCRAPTA